MIKRIVWFNFQRFLQYWKISSVHCIFYVFHIFIILQNIYDKGNNKITELRTILQRESPNS